MVWKRTANSHFGGFQHGSRIGDQNRLNTMNIPRKFHGTDLFQCFSVLAIIKNTPDVTPCTTKGTMHNESTEAEIQATLCYGSRVSQSEQWCPTTNLWGD